MRQWLRRARAAVGMGLAWAVAWAPAAVLLGMVVDPDGSMDEMWVAIGAYAGFLGGVLFAIVLGILGRRRRFDELSLRAFAAWGAAAGLVAGSLPFTIGTTAPGAPSWLLPAVVSSVTLLSAASAAGSLMLARRAERRLARGDGADFAGVGSPDRKAETRLP